jgi:hypothetical protein
VLPGTPSPASAASETEAAAVTSVGEDDNDEIAGPPPSTKLNADTDEAAARNSGELLLELIINIIAVNAFPPRFGLIP